MRIVIMGAAVTCGNRGVLALGASLVNLCVNANRGGELKLLVANCDNKPMSFWVNGEVIQVPVANCRLSPRSRLRDHLLWILLLSLVYRLMPMEGVRAFIARSSPWIKAVAEADIVGDVRGGDSFSDIYGFQGFLLGFLMASSVLLIRATMIQFPQTFGPYKGGLARRMAKFLLKRSSVIVARDEYSRALAQQFVGAEREVLLSPDVAFSLEAVKPEPFELDSLPSRPASGKVIGLNVNGLMYNGGYTRNNMFGLKMRYTEFLPELIRALLAEHAGELWLVPHTYAKDGDVESDNECSKKLMEKLPPVLRARIRIVNREYDPHQLKWIIGQCGFFVGSRMHSCIAALSQGVPCVGVAYSGKFDGVFNSVGLAGWVVDGRVSEANSAVKRIVELYRQREGVKKQLLRRAGAAREQLKELFDHLVDRHTPGASEPVCHETAGVLVTTQ